jgi:aminoglycoside N3'-acetyltransferase
MSNRLVLLISREPGCSHFLPMWRACAPGHSFVASDVGDAYARFLRMWNAVSQAIAYWHRSRRPAPAFPTADDRAFLAGGAQ